MVLIVTLEVFSGRVNPEWTLTPADSAEFDRRLAALTPSTGASTGGEQPLGYRGFNVRGGAAPVRVFRGGVMNGAQPLADPGRTLERWLLSTAGAAIDASLTTYVDSEISSVP